MTVSIRRVYDDPGPQDGRRVLVDRLWPRGVAKKALHLDEWAKDVAPSAQLRTWYGHRPERFSEFAVRYRTELADNPTFAQLRELVGTDHVTLLTATKDVEHSQAQVLHDLLTRTEPS